MSDRAEKKKEIQDAIKNIVEAKGSARVTNKRDKEVRYMLWIDKELMKKVKLKALEEETTVKDLIEYSLKTFLKDFE
ncbi:MAG: hypothetical protein B7X86_14405 [Sphingobacteriales bacterium 17-39-43]|uniref:hypothetical protein n=1 Tax=Daejeonella sp. TaxID=2805397 RepID=UPI000BD508D8|nr:hypothetical protein [Daejeonella sp.]OYZ30139.1 MAG: hypothetical protein B7Y24_14170 [Sphingobacteriales bacterium 16-39-50]OZA22857.1 MAG: hypothetical protein B7X86_14405 [Sphingobacteriales bacterium 17-39-43]HQT23991.1 hypothetical protein [Daejeonella sp.]HQT58655.1 hypothetical protein [Daejeonella sp.]